MGPILLILMLINGSFFATAITIDNPANDTSTAEVYKYAPVPAGPSGEKQLTCVAVNYADHLNDYMTGPRCRRVAGSVARFYDRNSRGKLTLIPHGVDLKSDGNAWSSWQRAENIAKGKFKSDYYIIPNLFRKGGNHASSKIAHVTQLTGWVIDHEVGHLIGFKHTGSYSKNAKGVWVYNQYGDRDSVMGGGGTGSSYFTAPQYFTMGWLPKEEAALYEEGKTYKLKKVSDFAGKNALTTVVIPTTHFTIKNGRRAFVAWPLRCDGCVALYLANPGESSLITTTRNEYYDDKFTGIHIKVSGYDAERKRIKVKIDFEPKPAAFKNSDVLDQEESPKLEVFKDEIIEIEQNNNTKS